MYIYIYICIYMHIYVQQKNRDCLCFPIFGGEKTLHYIFAGAFLLFKTFRLKSRTI